MPGRSSTETTVTEDFTYSSPDAKSADIEYIMDTKGITNPTTLVGLPDADIRNAYLRASRYSPKNKNMGGAVVDDLGYMHGGMKEKKRGPVKYSVGGAIKGKNFAGSF
jgi:hypothetical protein